MTDPLSGHAGQHRRPAEYLALNPLFAAISSRAMAALDAAASWTTIEGGSTLFAQGDPPDALYVVVRGTLHVLVEDGSGDRRSVEFLDPGALVGELGVLLGEPRTATIQAVRDAELLRVPAGTFLGLLETEPALGVSVSRLLGRRLTHTTRRPAAPRRLRTVALLPIDGQPLPAGFTDALMRALASAGGRPVHLSSAIVDRELGPGAAAIGRGDAGDSRLLELCESLEREHSLVIYEGDPAPGPWTSRALRQADLVLLVADAAASPRPGPVEGQALARRPPSSIELVPLQHADVAAGSTSAWLKGRSLGAHHHVRLDRLDTFARLARFVTGRATGLVLSGGGARGFAHIGVLKALAEGGVDVDVVGGSSMGAIVAAQHACGFDAAAMIEMNRRAFSGSDLTDYTVPAVALRKGRSTVRNLSAMFGDRHIEDLPIRLFCITSDLTHARVRVHDQGPVWLWTRASCSIPGLAPPVPCDGALLVDGGLLDNLPVDVMRRRCSGAVIAVNVTPTVDLTTDAPLAAQMSGWPTLWRILTGADGDRSMPNIAQILSRTVFVSSVRRAQEQARRSDLYLEPPLDGIGMSDFAAIDDIVDAGYRHARARLDSWRAAPGASSGQ